ncbi:MAG TPA: hypothetical protein VMT35_12090, partial [Ignavibacteriaceae bacterium]|nr:hypothetical protein [Ignavibacteriaceae bacterium]
MIRRTLPVITSISFLLSSFNVNTQNEGDIERKHLFDYNWKFYLGDYSAASRTEFDDTNWRVLDLPHDWSIEGKIDKRNPTGGAGGYFPAGIGWYRKKIFIPSSWENKHVSIYFEGVYSNSEVFIN